MLTVLRAQNGSLADINPEHRPAGAAWWRLVAPTDDELARTAEQLGVDEQVLRIGRDPDELPRVVEHQDGGALMVLAVPAEGEHEHIPYDAESVTVVVGREHIVTVARRPCAVIERLVEQARAGADEAFNRPGGLAARLIFTVSSHYVEAHRHLKRNADDTEAALHHSQGNRNLGRLVNLQKSFAYLGVTLPHDRNVAVRLCRCAKAAAGGGEPAGTWRFTRADLPFLEQAIINFDQAKMMSEAYRDILGSTGDAFSSLVQNNLNIVMKILTLITILITVPTMVTGFFGMNIPSPLDHNPHAFGWTLLISIFLEIAAFIGLARIGF